MTTYTPTTVSMVIVLGLCSACSCPGKPADRSPRTGDIVVSRGWTDLAPKRTMSSDFCDYDETTARGFALEPYSEVQASQLLLDRPWGHAALVILADDVDDTPIRKHCPEGLKKGETYVVQAVEEGVRIDTLATLLEGHREAENEYGYYELRPEGNEVPKEKLVSVANRALERFTLPFQIPFPKAVGGDGWARQSTHHFYCTKLIWRAVWDEELGTLDDRGFDHPMYISPRAIRSNKSMVRQVDVVFEM